MGQGWTRGAAAIVGAMLLAGAAQAQAVPPSQDPPADPGAEARAVRQVLTAAELADWGRARGDAGALIMAARLLAETPPRRVEGGAPILTPGGLLDEAAVLAADNPGALAAITRLRDASRGVRVSAFGRGPVFTVKEIQARETYWFEVEARGGEILRVAAIGDGDTNIDLRLRDARGAVVCEDGFGDHYPVCTVTPAQGGRMRIEIVNHGDVWTRVQILSN